MNRIIVVFLMLVGLSTSMCAQKYRRYFAAKDMYMFGVCLSVADSTVYFTDIKQVPNTSIERGTGFLYSRNAYSNQLQQYFRSTSGGNCTAEPAITRSALSLRRNTPRCVRSIRRGISLLSTPTISHTIP